MGATVNGATPIPAETSETARLRWRSNQVVTVAISGAKMAPPPAPTRAPNTHWNSLTEETRLARTRPRPSRLLPDKRTARGPNRSVAMPQPKLAVPMATKLSVIASEISAHDQPVAADIGCRKTGREKIEPIATQPIKAPAATITQR